MAATVHVNTPFGTVEDWKKASGSMISAVVHYVEFHAHAHCLPTETLPSGMRFMHLCGQALHQKCMQKGLLDMVLADRIMRDIVRRVPYILGHLEYVRAAVDSAGNAVWPIGPQSETRYLQTELTRQAAILSLPLDVPLEAPSEAVVRWTSRLLWDIYTSGSKAAADAARRLLDEAIKTNDKELQGLKTRLPSLSPLPPSSSSRTWPGQQPALCSAHNDVTVEHQAAGLPL